jgi:uncharacterized protein (DUF1499 family)
VWFVAITWSMVPRLPPCPESPNCVSSEADPADRAHFIPPLPLPDALSPEAALAAFEALVRAAPRTVMHARGPLSLRASQQTWLFRFVDDIEAGVDPQARRLYVRSASRVGHGDLGTNRRRVAAWLRELARQWRVDWP